MSFLKPAESYAKAELNDMIERVKRGDRSLVYELVVFTLAESWGIWHGRARAKICRYLRNHPPDATLQSKLVDTVCTRLETGRFSQQFRDQLRMAIRFSADRMRLLADSLLSSEKMYIRRSAAWVLQRIASHDALVIKAMDKSWRSKR